MAENVIVFASQQYGEYWSGLGSYATWLIDAMPRQYSIYVICPQSPGRKISNRILHVPVTGAKWDPTHGKWFSLSRQYAKMIKRIAEANEISFIHFTDAREAFFSVFLLHPDLRQKMVGTLHDFYFAAFRCNPFFYTRRYLDGWKRWFYYLFVNRVERLTFPRIPLLIANTDYVRITVADAYQLDRSNIKTIYIGLPDFWLEKSKVKNRPTRKKNQLLFVGGNYQRKGILNLARAVQIVKQEIPDIKVVVIGRDPNLHAIEREIKKIGSRENFEFLGYLPFEQMSDYYWQSTVLFMPAQIEAYGLVFLEAVACGCPVVGSTKGGTAELFEMMGTGNTVNPDDIAAIAGEIKNLLQNEKYQKQIADGKVNLLSLTKTVDKTKFYVEDLLIQ